MTSLAGMTPLSRVLYKALDSIALIDSHSHINPYAPASENLGDLLGYHYYTELAHSSGMDKSAIEEPGISAKEKVKRLFGHLANIDNTVQWSWFLELSQELFGFSGDYIDSSNWEQLFDLASNCMAQPDWESQVLSKSNVEKVFLTNDFDDSLTGFDTQRYVPCLRTDDLVFHIANPATRKRLLQSTGIEPANPQQIRECLSKLFEHFCANQARACAISLPPWFTPVSHSQNRAGVATAFDEILAQGLDASEANRQLLAEWIFWQIAELADHHQLPFDLMIGVNRKVYPTGVFQGQDLYDSRVSLIQYSELFNAFPKLKFPISVLASVTNQELVDYAWIFPNVITHGHWWYSNTPNYIRHDLRGRIEAIPRNKQIGYYSDAYKLEFILPKFRMYKRLLAETLATEYCGARGWTETKAIGLGHQILRGNVESIFNIS